MLQRFKLIFSAGLLHARLQDGWSLVSIEIENGNNNTINDYIQSLVNDVCAEQLTQVGGEAAFRMQNVSKFSDVAQLVSFLDNPIKAIFSNLSFDQYFKNFDLTLLMKFITFMTSEAYFSILKLRPFFMAKTLWFCS